MAPWAPARAVTVWVVTGGTGWSVRLNVTRTAVSCVRSNNVSTDPATVTGCPSTVTWSTAYPSEGRMANIWDDPCSTRTSPAGEMEPPAPASACTVTYAGVGGSTVMRSNTARMV